MWTRGLAALLLAASLASAQTSKTAPKKSAPKKSVPKTASKTPPKTSPKTTAKAPPAPVVPAVQPTGRGIAPPKDESSRDPALAKFLADLKDVLKRKDRNALLAMLAPDIDSGIRNMVGPGAFFTAWGLTDKDSSVYGVMSQILSMPGAWVDQQYCAPYVSVLFPPDLDRSKHQVVLNPNVRVRQTESATAPTVATVSYEIVEVLNRGNEWTKIRTSTGAEGYIQIAYLYSPAGYRACFGKGLEGTWQVQSLAVPR